MSLVAIPAAGERPVHFPANPDRFGFDAEVSKVFPDMALRSIPNFAASHAAHAAMLRPFIENRHRVSVLDIGASRGAFFAALKHEYPDTPNMELHAIDSSADMCALLAEEQPDVTVTCTDITGPDFLADPSTYDVVCAHYVVQFLPREMQMRVLHKIFAKVKTGGVLIYGHKAMHWGMLGNEAHEQYILFRLRNGYTREEIEAKTRALKNSMFCQDHDFLMDTVKSHFRYVQETFRFMMFNTFMAVK